MGNDMLIAGTPDDCIAGIRRAIAETGCETILVSTGGEPSAEMMTMFTREVTPAFA